MVKVIHIRIRTVIWFVLIPGFLPFATFSELELESSFFIKNLNSMIIGISHNYIILCVYCDSRWLSKLTFEHPELAKLKLYMDTSF